jgi:thymidylate kinase
MNGVIVLEGPDGSGKSFLAEHLKKRFGALVFHQSYKPEWDMFEYHTGVVLEALSHSQEKLVVIDRLWLSEMVYSRVYRGGSKWPMLGNIISRVLEKHAAITVLCVSEKEQTAARHAKLKNERDEMFSNGMDLVAGEYLAIAEVSKGRPDIMRYSIEENGSDLDAFCDELLVRMAEFQLAQYAPALDFDRQNILGHKLLAEFLIVGDIVNSKFTFKNHRVEWPFYDHGHSSLFLMESLSPWFDVSRAMWTNANADDEHIAGILAEKSLKVIALGKEAEHALSELGVEHCSVYHPQFARRFNKKTEFVNQLKSALNDHRLECLVGAS